MEKVFEKMLDDWLDDVFDNNATLVNEAWVEKVSAKTGRWIFDSEQIRGRVFHEAQIETKHILR